MARHSQLTKAERAIEESLDEYIPVKKEEYIAIVEAIESRRKDAVLNVRVNSKDLEGIKQKAKKLGIKYQTFVSEILHKIAQA